MDPTIIFPSAKLISPPVKTSVGLKSLEYSVDSEVEIATALPSWIKSANAADPANFWLFVSLRYSRVSFSIIVAWKLEPPLLPPILVASLIEMISPTAYRLPPPSNDTLVTFPPAPTVTFISASVPTPVIESAGIPV